MPTFYKKRHPQNPVYLSVGHPVKFEDLGMGYGYFNTSDQTIIAYFSTLMAEHRGGIELSSPEEYEDALKKKPALPKLDGSLIRELQTAGLVVPDLASPAVSAAVKNASKLPLVGVGNTMPSTEPAAPAAPAPIPEPKLGKRKT